MREDADTDTARLPLHSKRSGHGLCPRKVGGRLGRGAKPPSERKYHGRVKALVDATRAAGLAF